MLIQPEVLDRRIEDMRRALETERLEDVAALAAGLSPARTARLLMTAPEAVIVATLRELGPDRSGPILAKFPPEAAADFLEALPDPEAGDFLDAVPPDRGADIYAALDERHVERLLADVAPEERDELRRLARYPEGSAGGVMTSRFLAIPLDTSVGRAVEAIRAAPTSVERSHYVYVVDDEERLAGVLSLRDLMGRDPALPVSEVMVRDVITARVDDPAEEAARRLRNRRFLLLPVVDGDGRLVGVITMDDAIEILSEQLSGAFLALGASSPDESFFTPPMESVRKRLPWMSGNVILNLGAVSVIAFFEETIAQVAILAAFIPMITDMGGNVGIQALSVAIRSIALGEAHLGQVVKAVRKEMAVGVVNGLALGGLFAAIAVLLEGNVALALVAGAALATNVLVAGLVGGTIPFLIKRWGKDPAMMTGPILTTITDITGVSIYLGLSTLFLTQILG